MWKCHLVSLRTKQDAIAARGPAQVGHNGGNRLRPNRSGCGEDGAKAPRNHRRPLTSQPYGKACLAAGIHPPGTNRSETERSHGLGTGRPRDRSSGSQTRAKGVGGGHREYGKGRLAGALTAYGAGPPPPLAATLPTSDLYANSRRIGPGRSSRDASPGGRRVQHPEEKGDKK